MYSYFCWIRTPNGSSQRVYTNARSVGEAQQIFESTYGRSNMLSLACVNN